MSAQWIGSILLWLFCANASLAAPAPGLSFKASSDAAKVFITPSPQFTPVISAIHPPAGTPVPQTIVMTMFHLSNPGVVAALIAAKKSGTDIRIIVDRNTLKSEATARTAQAQLMAAQIPVRASSSKFSLTHQKSMVINHDTAFVMSMNLTDKPDVTRDIGIITQDPNVVNEMETVFEVDWNNAENDTNTPLNLQENDPLIWSPPSSRAGLMYLIAQAKSSIKITSESLDDPDILAALQKAAAKIPVQIIGPMCLENPNPLLNYPFLKGINGTKFGQARVMPTPSTPALPYVHAKLILIDEESSNGQLLYVGSINMTKNSINHDRELGIILNDATVIKTVAATFGSDWNVSVRPPANPPCDGKKKSGRPKPTGSESE